MSLVYLPNHRLIKTVNITKPAKRDHLIYYIQQRGSLKFLINSVVIRILTGMECASEHFIRQWALEDSTL